MVTVGVLQSGRANNVIPDSAHLELSVRALDPEVRSLLQQRITEIAHAQAQSFGVKAEIDYRRGYAALINSKDETDFARQIGTELVGAERVVLQAPPLTGSEDFAFMLEKRPGSYLLIGNGDGDKLGACMVHNPGYDFNDANLAIWRCILGAAGAALSGLNDGPRRFGNAPGLSGRARRAYEARTQTRPGGALHSATGQR